MAKQVIRSAQDICADCGALEPNWASLNRGILICDECVVIHRSLGRNISQVKSIKKSNWRLSQIQMIVELHRSGANSIWEHTLLDPQHGRNASRRKPSAKDALHPNKSEFIRAKYQSLSFMNRSTTKEESETDISEQLHSSVRTPNLKTSLRLLASGANLNYIHNEKYNSPLHMAAKSGQISQIELLIVYGANPSIVDVRGKTPIDYAKEANFNEMAERLIECQYELSDRLTYFVCGRTPDHKNGQHYLIPEMVDTSEQSEQFRYKLESLSHRLFEELSRDVYDEVDRREIDAICNASQPLNSQVVNNDKQVVPFLPVNPQFSSTRNQGRQKLARFDSKEFATLIIDVLCEIRRRLHGMPTIGVPKTSFSNILKTCAKKQSDSDESSDYDSEPLYDSVPSEDEDISRNHLLLNKCGASGKMSDKRALPSKQTVKPETSNSSVTLDEYCILKDQLCRSDSLIQELVLGNKDMRYEITRLQIMVQKLIDENAQLRAVVIPKSSTNCLKNSLSEGPPPEIMPRSLNKAQTRPQSMYERPIPPSCPAKSSASLSNLQHNSIISSRSPSLNSSHSNEQNNIQMTQNHGKDGLESISFINSVGESSTSLSSNSFQTKFMLTFPTKEEVLRKTERITKRIQELLITAQEGKHEDFESCSDKINSAVAEMISIFPESFVEMSTFPNGDQIFLALSQLHSSALKLRVECRASLNLNLNLNPKSHQHMQQDFRVIYQKVIESAFEIAKSAKILVTLFQ